ncbi:MAG: cyclic nucleotide-binding domain-containing protein [Dehalococcoidia bacterium]|nr:cyclic nucleotide-binding domain-containing protein [Dehalococcoidia bacterium]
MSYVDTLRKAEYFVGITDEGLELIDEFCRLETYDEGTVLYHEGDVAKDLYVVQKGKVSIRIEEGQTRPLTVTIVSDGEAFGWSALVEPHRFTAGAKCLEKTSIVVIDGPKIHELCQGDSHLGVVIMENLAYLISCRLRHARQQIPIQSQGWE